MPVWLGNRLPIPTVWMMDAIGTFFEMGGHAAYVWPAFGIAAGLMIGMVVWTRIALKADRRTLDLLQAARRGRRGTGKAQAGAGGRRRR